MRINFLSRARANGFGRFLFAGLTFALACFLTASGIQAQAKKTAAPKTPPKQKAVLNLPKVTQIDGVKLAELIKREDGAKPLLVNFWATWCVPCVEEFPDLVRLDNDFRGKVEIITVSLDDLADIDTAVPKFLAEMKAEMPAYLLKTADEQAAISSVSKDWSGALPFTILIGGKGETVYSKQGKFKPDVLRAEIEKIISLPAVTTVDVNLSSAYYREVLELPSTHYSYERGVKEAKGDIAAGRLIIRRYGLTIGIAPESLKKLKENYGVEIVEHGCLIMPGFVEYVRGYNETSQAEIERRFGDKVSKIIGKE
jgi:thiol-disulfide isomerase/thioredoxin